MCIRGRDSSYCLLTSLEFLDDKGELKRKADIFTKRTIRRAETVTSVDTASEALAVSIGERAGVDLSYMAQLSGKTEEKLTEELAGVIFKNPISEKWEPSDEYLSGNVREKLQIAKQFAEDHPEYQAVSYTHLDVYKRQEKDTPETSENQGVSTPGSHGSDATSVSNSPKTGDNTNIAIFVLALAVSAGCLGTVVTVKRKRK